MATSKTETKKRRVIRWPTSLERKVLARFATGEQRWALDRAEEICLGMADRAVASSARNALRRAARAIAAKADGQEAPSG